MANQACMEITAKILKIIAYILTFVLVLSGGVIAKGTQSTDSRSDLISLTNRFYFFTMQAVYCLCQLN